MACRCEANTELADCATTTATHLYRIAQEAVNNAMKHSEARGLSIRLNEAEEWLDLTVEDDGKGIGIRRRESAGMGLHTMEYRARSMGGTLQIFPGDPTGTVVRCRIPKKPKQ